MKTHTPRKSAPWRVLAKQLLISIFTFGVLAFFALDSSAAQSEGNASVQAAPAHVVLITIDAFPARMFDDPRTVIPNIKALAAQGVRAPAMIASNPTSTWSNHTTLVTGVYARKHSVLFNGLVLRGEPGASISLEREASGSQLVAVPSIFDILHAAGHSSAAINWPCTRGSSSIDDNFPDTPGMLKVTTPRLVKDMVSSGILRTGSQSDFAHLEQPGHDSVWTQAACHIIRTRMPDLLTIHLLNTDEINHAYGPESLASYTSLSLADRLVGDIVAAIDAAGLRESTTLLVVSDHGCAAAKKVICPNVLLRQAGFIKMNKNQIVQARVQVRTLGGSAFVYFTNPATHDEDRKRVIELFTGREGLAEVIGPERFAELGLPDAGKGGCGDLLLRAKIGYGIVNTATGDEFVSAATHETNIGFHGYINDSAEMNAIFVASGRGIKSGSLPGAIHNVDVAPTIMQLLGRSLPASDGRVLTEILSTP